MNSRRSKLKRRLDGKVSIDPRHNPDVKYLMKPAGDITDEAVEFCIRLVRRSGQVERFVSMLSSSEGRTRCRITVEGLLVGWAIQMCVLKRPPELTEIAEVLFERIPVRWDGRFQRKETDPITRTTDPRPAPSEKDRLAFYASVRRLWRKLVLTTDSFPYPKNRRLTLAEVDALPRLAPAEAAAADALKVEVTNNLLGAFTEMAREILPTNEWEAYGAVDATLMEANAKPPSIRRGLASIELQGTKYERKVPAKPKKTTTKDGRPLKRRDTPDTMVTKTAIGYEVTIKSSAPNPLSEYRDLPEFAEAMILHGCGYDPAGNGEAVLVQAEKNGAKPSLLAFDSAYVKLPFLAACRRLGYEVLFEPLATQTSNAPTHLGAIIHAGGPLCPGIPEGLLRIEDAYNRGEIDAELRDKLIAERETYRMWRKDVFPNGTERWVCPALPAPGRKPRLACQRRPDSTSVEGLQIVAKPPKANPDPDIERHNVCTASGVIIDPGDYLLEWQACGHHTPDWRIYYAALRNAVERDNSQTKAGYGMALGMPDRRGLRGMANHAHMAAWLLLGHNVELLRSWLRKSEKDKDGVITLAPLKNRRGKRRPKHARPKSPAEMVPVGVDPETGEILVPAGPAPPGSG